MTRCLTMTVYGEEERRLGEEERIDEGQTNTHAVTGGRHRLSLEAREPSPMAKLWVPGSETRRFGRLLYQGLEAKADEDDWQPPDWTLVKQIRTHPLPPEGRPLRKRWPGRIVSELVSDGGAVAEIVRADLEEQQQGWRGRRPEPTKFHLKPSMSEDCAGPAARARIPPKGSLTGSMSVASFLPLRREMTIARQKDVVKPL
ncbi:hypothetical protein VUR80DRAFT_8848 [Thermomyces stellatus]